VSASPGNYFPKRVFQPVSYRDIPENFFHGCHFSFATSGTFPNGGRPQFLQNLLSAVFSVPQWLQYGMDAIPSKIKFNPHETIRAQVL
jgi:hypothetical protein